MTAANERDTRIGSSPRRHVLDQFSLPVYQVYPRTELDIQLFKLQDLNARACEASRA